MYIPVIGAKREEAMSIVIFEQREPYEPKKPTYHHLKGFASFSPEKRREVASRGGKKASELGTAHRFSHEEAVAAGRVGGAKSRRGAKHPI